MTAARRLAPVSLTLLEKSTPHPGTRTRWTLALVEISAHGSRTLATWTGTGPLGRLRAHRDAQEFCHAQQLEPTEQLEDTRKPCNLLAWEHARLLARLRGEGVI